MVIGNVGGLRPEKNQALLLRATARMRDRDHCRVVLVGDGPERSRLAELTAELGLSELVSFRGARQDTAGEYRDMDVFALSSYTEQMPLSVLEAMASGLPVVSTRVGDVPEMLAVEGRELVVGRDEAEYARALDRLVGSPELRRAVGEANRRRCEAEYELETCLARYLTVYEASLA